MFKKILFLSFFFALLNCSQDNLPENCIRPVSFSITRSFDNPDFNKILTIGSVEINGGFKGILIINAGLDRFLAYDKICPNNDCNSPMIYDEINKPNILECSCDGSQYGLGIGIGGAPQTEGFECAALEYNAVKIGNSIRISNF
jgi:Rieske Fe-S protein